MGKINVLPAAVAELIAAGEVVDRPASIIKELVENALDAGATRITVELNDGGITYLRVSDNGSGMTREDVPLAFIRHATSKIASEKDLDSIGTLGFRGEALPSIAAVSRVKVIARTAESPIGCRYSITANEPPVMEDIGCGVGTSIEVRDIFYNTPARMKFLKKDATEGNAVASLMDRLALANPAVALEFIRDGKRMLKTPGDGKLLSVLRVVCGAEMAAGMIPVSLKSEGVLVTGLISRPNVSRSTRSLQTFFINSRYVRSKTCAGAVEEAYKNRLMTGRFPACVLNLEVDFNTVDVNVHPAKLEVRFSNERTVYNAVYSACVDALSQHERGPVDVKRKKINTFSLSDFDYSERQVTLRQVGRAADSFAPAFPPNPQNAIPVATKVVTAGYLPLVADASESADMLELHDDTQLHPVSKV
ncbi:MAG TPA: DNA mismatch repair endonuclease MutL, partial [Clostridia bacterium]|nr:DNA mismatch repair endonuclease MutL [Clostridia bacterium]